MEDQDKNSCVALILEDSRLLVDRVQLVSKSQYFATLLSENYSDHLQKEHVINYDIPISTLKDYISWIHDEQFCMEFDFVCRSSLEKYCNCSDYEDLLKLLHLSVLFLTDQLTEEITIIIEGVLLIPKFLIDIWLAAMDLSLSTLQDILFAACLDHFDNLPTDKLIQLESNNLQKLINNANISSTKEHIYDILFMWMKANEVDDLPVALSVPIKNKEPKILNCIIDFEIPQNHNSKISLYCWDGRNFFKYSTVTYPEEIIDTSQALVGMQSIGRRYNLYICGGEYGHGREKFNEKIWRYSLISKNWFVDTHMPVPRSHMITVFFENKLYFIGGVGRHRKQLNIVNIYNVHSRVWTMGPCMPTGFTTIPEYCVSDDKLFIHMNKFHVLLYCSTVDTWSDIKLYYDIFLSQEIILMGLGDSACFIEATNKGYTDNIVVRCVKYETGTKCPESDINYTCEDFSLLSKTSLKLMFCKSFTFNPFLKYTFHLCSNNNIYVWFDENHLHHPDIHHTIRLHSFPIQESIKVDSLFSSVSSTTRKFFHIMDPAYLYSESETTT